jgi:NADH-quinone oxidoreductase subunit H
MAFNKELEMLPEIVVAMLEFFLFPGFLFIILYSFFIEWLDRKFVAKFQNRYGPLHVGPKGILQPVADILKLLSKEDITPNSANEIPFKLTPLLMFSFALTPFFCIPIVNNKALIAFSTDLIVVVFFMSCIPVLSFIAAWVSTNRFSTIGGTRLALQMFGYEIPLVLALVSPTITTQAFSISQIVEWQMGNFWLFLVQPIGFVIVIICLLAHLQRLPFDMPEAETELVGGWFVEFSGKKLALIKLTKSLELTLAISLIVSLYLGGPSAITITHPLVYVLKSVLCLFIFANLKALFARFRIDQFLIGAWKYLTPLAILQIVIIQIMS